MHLKETGCGGVDWIQMAQYRDQWQAAMYTKYTLDNVQCLI